MFNGEDAYRSGGSDRADLSDPNEEKVKEPERNAAKSKTTVSSVHAAISAL